MIVVEIEALQDSDHRDGDIARYIRRLLQALVSIDCPICLTFNPDLPPPLFDHLETVPPLVPATREALGTLAPNWLLMTLPFAKSFGRTRDMFTSLFPSAKTAAMVFDIPSVAFEKNDLSDPVRRAVYAVGMRLVLSADCVFTLSTAAAEDVRSRLPLRGEVIVLGCGVDQAGMGQAEADGDDARRFAALSRRYPCLSSENYLLTTSGGAPNGNLSELLTIYGLLPPLVRLAYPLVVASNLPAEVRLRYEREWQSRTGTDASDQSLLVLPDLSKDDRFVLYRHCRAYTLADVDKGFDLALGDAIACGAVCTIVGRGALPEILPETRFQFESSDPKSASRRIHQSLTDEEFRESFRLWRRDHAPAPSWSELAMRVGGALGAETNSTSHARTARKTFAFIGPLSPSETGIASYNDSLLPSLLSRDTHWIVTEGAPPLHAKTSPYVLPHPLWRHAAPTYDHNVVVIGNSSHHLEALSILDQHPSTVWLHDVYLGSLLWSAACSRNGQDVFAYLNNAGRVYPGNAHRPMSSFADLQSSRRMFARVLLGNATSFIVHSEHARSMLELDLGTARMGRRIFVVPHAIPRHDSAPKRSDKTQIVGILGFITPLKQPELIIEAIGLLIGKGENILLKIIGQCDPAYRNSLENLAARQGVDIRLTGFLPESDFLQQASECDLVVQLKEFSTGESSGTVAHAIGMGIDVITNIPSVGEMWADLVCCFDTKPTASALAEKIQASLARRRFEVDDRLRVRPVPERFAVEAVTAAVLDVVLSDSR